VTHVGYLVGGYTLTAVALAAYVLRLRWRGRALARAGLRGPNAVDGLRGPNAVDGLRGPNAAAETDPRR
jgi:hypothetical protein